MSGAAAPATVIGMSMARFGAPATAIGESMAWFGASAIAIGGRGAIISGPATVDLSRDGEGHGDAAGHERLLAA
jgi:hypothetical protein